MNAFIPELQSQLTGLLTLSHEMQACLLEERVALSNLDIQAMQRLTEHKHAMVTALEQQTLTLHKLLSSAGIQSGIKGLGAWLHNRPNSALKQTLIQDWQNIHELTLANRQMNESNGACVSLSQRQAQRSIEILRGQTSTGAQTYGPDGNTRSAGYSGRHSIA